ncbi:Hypothetical protein DEACI_0179 [Acididesulfobacillus acetoxydans]|uniref:Uncharacterized protein n=1 Tax=Acididesulfobacillus acetoxydans TaxID=1561005 RepID=A0A8S0VVI3_9FIRM|nr:Hypothetical protein DEACI_0179 [Acididesulfobacillus acetoxydans]CEJ07748.1 Hypothetical protein DEACI_2214 [Acididesulfobacillus acetoxydans]
MRVRLADRRALCLCVKCFSSGVQGQVIGVVSRILYIEMSKIRVEIGLSDLSLNQLYGDAEVERRRTTKLYFRQRGCRRQALARMAQILLQMV